jgi:hypothetical protein
MHQLCIILMHSCINERTAVNAITLRNLPEEVARAVRRKAKQEGLSLNRAVARLLQEAVGGTRSGSEPATYHDLDALAGAWSDEEADAFDAALRDERRIDPKVWR